MVKSLKGLSVLITRPRPQALELAHQLEELGADPVLLPCIDIAEPLDWTDADRAAKDLHRYDWIVFTSVNGVEAFLERLGPVLPIARIAAVGSSTEAALRRAGWPVDLVPEKFVSDAIADLLDEVVGRRILMVRGDRARMQLPEILESRGAQVDHAVVYRIVDTHPQMLVEGLRRLASKGLPDAVTFTSPSAAQALFQAAREAGLEDWIRQTPIVCIGPVTAEVVQEVGLKPTVVAEEYTIPGLVDALSRLEALIA